MSRRSSEGFDSEQRRPGRDSFCQLVIPLDLVFIGIELLAKLVYPIRCSFECELVRSVCTPSCKTLPIGKVFSNVTDTTTVGPLLALDELLPDREVIAAAKFKWSDTGAHSGFKEVPRTRT